MISMIMMVASNDDAEADVDGRSDSDAGDLHYCAF